MMFDVGVGVCFCSALLWVGCLCLFSVWFVGDVSSDVCCGDGVGDHYCSTFGL